MKSEAKFEITGWLSGEVRFATRQGNGGEFLVGSLTISVGKRSKDNTVKGEYRKYFIDISGKGVERLKKDVEAGHWQSGDLITVKGELVTGPVTQDPETGKNRYGRTFMRCWEFTNWDDYSRGHMERRKIRGFGKEDFKDFKYGENKEEEEAVL